MSSLKNPTGIKPAVFRVIAEAMGVPVENVNEDTIIPTSKLKDVLDMLAHSYNFCLQYTQANYTAGQILEAAF